MADRPPFRWDRAAALRGLPFDLRGPDRGTSAWFTEAVTPVRAIPLPVKLSQGLYRGTARAALLGAGTKSGHPYFARGLRKDGQLSEGILGLCAGVTLAAKRDEIRESVGLPIERVHAGHIAKKPERPDVVNLHPLPVFLFVGAALPTQVLVAQACRTRCKCEMEYRKPEEVDV